MLPTEPSLSSSERICSKKYLFRLLICFLSVAVKPPFVHGYQNLRILYQIEVEPSQTLLRNCHTLHQIVDLKLLWVMNNSRNGATFTFFHFHTNRMTYLSDNLRVVNCSMIVDWRSIAFKLGGGNFKKSLAMFMNLNQQ